MIEYVARFLSKPESLIGMIGARGTVLYPDDHYLEEILLKSREFEDLKLQKEALSSIYPGINLDEALKIVKQLYWMNKENPTCWFDGAVTG